MSIQPSYVNQAANLAAQTLAIGPNDGRIAKAAKFSVGVPTNAAIAIAAFAQTVISAVVYTALFLPLYVTSQKEALQHLAGRVNEASATMTQAIRQISGVWAQVAAPSKWAQAKEMANNGLNRAKAAFNAARAFSSKNANKALEVSKPYLASAKQAAWNHKGKIALGTGLAVAAGAEWYAGYPVSSAVSSAASQGFNKLGNGWKALSTKATNITNSAKSYLPYNGTAPEPKGWFG